MAQHPLCVYSAKDEEEAAIVVAWLDEQGIPAMVPEADVSETVLWGSPSMFSAGVEVCVREEAAVAKARTLLKQHDAALRQRVETSAANQGVCVVCDKCGQTSTFPAETAGTVQECPHCKEFTDVPRPPLPPHH
jgi:hypothetical protein